MYRRIRFNLRAFLVTVTALSVLVGAWLQQGLRQRHAVQELEGAGLFVFYDENGWIPAKVVAAMGRDFFADVRGVFTLGDIDVRYRKQIARALSSLPGIRSLSLDGCSLTDAEMPAVGGLRFLTSLDLDGPDLTSRGCAEIRRLHHLESLTLNDCTLDRRALEAIAQLSALETLLLFECRVTEGFQTLAPQKNLRLVGLMEVSLPPGGVAGLARVPLLSSLTINECGPIDSELVGGVSQLTQLETLHLIGELCAPDLSQLAGLIKLKRLDFTLTNDFDATPINLLQSQMPGRNIGFRRLPIPAPKSSQRGSSDHRIPSLKASISSAAREIHHTPL